LGIIFIIYNFFIKILNKFNNKKFDVVALSAALDKLLSDVWDNSSQHWLFLSDAFYNYVWYNPAHASSRAGFLFERNLIDKAESILGGCND
jgi:hypothetical protein